LEDSELFKDIKQGFFAMLILSTSFDPIHKAKLIGMEISVDCRILLFTNRRSGSWGQPLTAYSSLAIS
jgi:hypothetical protein